MAGQPWFDGCITGVGDSVHATTPFLAQGGSMALEVAPSARESAPDILQLHLLGKPAHLQGMRTSMKSVHHRPACSNSKPEGSTCRHGRVEAAGLTVGWGAQSGVEVAVYLKKAMEQAGVATLSQLPTPALCAALREYEIVRSRRVSYIINKAQRFGATIKTDSWLVRAFSLPQQAVLLASLSQPSWTRECALKVVHAAAAVSSNAPCREVVLVQGLSHAACLPLLSAPVIAAAQMRLLTGLLIRLGLLRYFRLLPESTTFLDHANWCAHCDMQWHNAPISLLHMHLHCMHPYKRGGT